MPINSMYTNPCCGMIAVKREVAAYVAGFPWSECQEVEISKFGREP